MTADVVSATTPTVKSASKQKTGGGKVSTHVGKQRVTTPEPEEGEPKKPDQQPKPSKGTVRFGGKPPRA